MAGRVEWNGEAFQKRVRAEMNRRLAASSMIVENHAKELLSVAGTGVAASAFVGNGKVGKQEKKYRKGRRTYGSNPSKPGEPPHKQYGHLRRSVTFALDRLGLVSRVGTNLKKGRWLELGTSKMAARPWLRRALLEKRAQVAALLTKPLGGSTGGR